ncbi:hypothetical protein LTR37_003506 [Vermiconidia calcicola]|uniref:Uncharacterized protein n=1 Tax=Vermiconidia calcicola TaxID=1690605 RepID=A0ACC3NQ68_9PEZI|nr:hypothetical protein LTR37_003506 [Vermiconidia calcicola]
METGPQMASGTISPFFKLPLELRYEVYSEVLADGTTHYIIRHNGTKQAEPGLLKVCSDIRHEAMQFYYGRNQFGHVISNANITPAISWLHLIGTERLSHIRKLTFIIASSNWEANYYRHGDGRVLNVAALWVTKRSNWEPLLDKLQVSGVRDTAVRFRRSTRFEEDVQLEQFLGSETYGSMMQANVGGMASYNIQTALDQSSSPLMRLPAELRLRIYDYALTEDTYVMLLNDEGAKTGQPALLRTCRQIRNEALDLYYSSNVFALVVDVNGRKAMETEIRWTVRLGARCQLIKKFIIEICFLVSDLIESGVASEKIKFALAEDYRQQIKEGVRIGSGYYHELAGRYVHPRVVRREVEEERALMKYFVTYRNAGLRWLLRDYL